MCLVALLMTDDSGRRELQYSYSIEMSNSLCSLAVQSLKTKIDRSCSGTEEIGASHRTGRLNRGTMKRMWEGVASGLGPGSQ